MLSRTRRKFRRFALCCALLPMLAGCDRAIVSGRVLTVDGEALPGVVVSVEGEPGLEALTNTLGEYRLIPPVGLHALRYAKSGYAPAVSTVDVQPQSAIRIEDIFMWRLPRNKGVYLYENARFTPTTLGEPRTFLIEGETAEYAIRGTIDARTKDTDPLILCYHMPRYEARLTRLRIAAAQLREGQDYTFDAYARAGTIPVRLMPVDQPEGMLMEVVFDDPLEPGAYALHWGALIGETILEPRAYLFEIAAPPDEETAATESENADDDASDRKSDPEPQHETEN